MEQGGLSEEEMQLAIALPVSVGGYLVILFILAVLVGALRRRGKKQKKGDDDMYNYSAMYTGIEAATVFTNNEADDEGKSAFKPKPMRVSYRPKIPVMSHPLTMAELGTLLESEKSIINEFEAIPTNLISMDDVPPGAESKNRYRNILPNPHTRVPLFLKFGVANSDYINANYIRGSIGTPRSYISTQGPLWNTTPDFWRMIWEQRSSIVVMLTELTENNMTKCHQYWPDEQEGRTAIYDDIEVTLAKRVIEQSYTTTTFLLRHLEKGVTREVLHFWFRAWPDHDVPNTYEPFLNFVQSIRSASSDLPVGPITVHCSAGIGRSGVFLATLLGMESLEECGEVDVLKSVSSMRQDRGGMVQNKSQYVFIHMSLYQYGLWLERTKAPMKSFLVGDFPDSGSHTKLLDED
jgi:protein tyrosine phosphatase